MDERNSKNKIGVSTTSSNSSKQKSNPHIMKKSKPLSQNSSTTPKVKKLLKHRPEKFGIVVGKEEATRLEQYTYQLNSEMRRSEIKVIKEIFPNIETQYVKMTEETEGEGLTHDVIYAGVRLAVHDAGRDTHKHMVRVLYKNKTTGVIFSDVYGITNTKSCLFPLESYKDVQVLSVGITSVKIPPIQSHLVGCKNFLRDTKIELKGEDGGMLDYMEVEGLTSQHNDCAILLFEHELNEIWKKEAEEEARQKGVHNFKWKKPRASPVKVRKDLGLPPQDELLNVGEHMDKLEEHYNAHCVVWAISEEGYEFVQVRNTTKTAPRRKYLIEGFMMDGHMFRIKTWTREKDFGTCRECGHKFKSAYDRGHHKCDGKDVVKKEILDDMTKGGRVEMVEKTWDEHWEDLRCAILQHRHASVLGAGGVGKTMMMVWKVEKEFHAVFVSTTGVSALQLPRGETFHRGLGINCGLKNRGSKYGELTLEKTQCLVIDEISMCSGHMFDLIYERVEEINRVRVNDLGYLPLSLIIVGDPAQLPPIEKLVSDDMGSGFFFNGGCYDKFQKNALKIQLTEVKRTQHVEFVEVQKKVRFGIADEQVLQFLNPLCERGRVSEEHAVYICARKDQRDRYNTAKMEQMRGRVYEFHPMFEAVKGRSGEVLMDVTKTVAKTMVHKNSHFLIDEFAHPVSIKMGMFVMVTYNVCVEQGIANGTMGRVVGLDLEEGEVHIEDNRKVRLTIPYVSTFESVPILGDENNRRLRVMFMPLIQADAITINKVQGLTLQSIIVDCSMIWEAGQFYVALSRAVNPDNVELRNFNPQRHLRANTEVCRYLWRDEYISYTHRSLVMYNSDRANVIRTYPSNEILMEDSIFYDFETAPDELRPHLGHIPYFNYIIHRWTEGGKVCEERLELIHYTPERNVSKETYDYVMSKVIERCEKFRQAKKTKDNEYVSEQEKKVAQKTMSKYASPIYLCGYNASNFDLYFIMRELSKNEAHADRFRAETVFKGRTLVCFILTDRLTGKVALKGHDLCQIAMCSLADGCESFVGEKIKGRFPHLFMAREFFKDPVRVLSQTFDLTPEDYPKKDRKDLTEADLKGFNVLENLKKYGRNDTEILVRLYEAINRKVFLPVCEADVLRFATMGSISNYMFLKNLPSSCYYKKDDHFATADHSSKTLTRLFVCDMEEEEIIRQAIYGGKTLPRQHEFMSKDMGLPYKQIMDFLGYLDISGMYVNGMDEHLYPYDKAYHATPLQIKKWNEMIKQGQTRTLMTNVHATCTMKHSDGKTPPTVDWSLFPPFFVALVDIEPNECDIEPMLGRRVNQTLLWDNSRRVGWYGSVDILINLQNRGRIHEIKRLMYWKEHEFVFHKWMQKTLELKEEGNKMNDIEAGSGDALRAFGKLLGNASYGQNLRHDHQEVVQMIGSVEDKNKFLEHVNLMDIVINNEDPNGFHMFRGETKKIPSKFLTKRSIFLGLYVLQYSRLLLNNILKDLYGELRYREEGIPLQIKYSDTDSALVHSSLLPNLHQKGWIADVNGKLTDDLCSKKLKGNDKYNFLIKDPKTGKEILQLGKVIHYLGTAPKCYGVKYIIPSGKELEITKMKGISKSNMEYYDSELGDFNDSITFDTMLEMWHNRDGTGKPIPYEFHMPNRLTKTSVKLTKEQKLRGEGVFTIQSTSMSRCLFKTLWKGRKKWADGNSLVSWGTIWAGESYEEGVLLPPVLRRRHQKILKECIRAWCAVTPEGGGVRTAWRQRFLIRKVSEEESYQENENNFCSGSESMDNESGTEEGNKTETEEEGLMEWQ